MTNKTYSGMKTHEYIQDQGYETVKTVPSSLLK